MTSPVCEARGEMVVVVEGGRELVGCDDDLAKLQLRCFLDKDG